MPKALWPAQERSTRNCFNAKAVAGSVKCSKTGHFIGRKKIASEAHVIHLRKFYPECEICIHFDNDWGIL